MNKPLDNPLAVLKFGGTSVATTEKIQSIAHKLAARYKTGEKLVVVVSAMGKSTDTLVTMANQVSENPDKRHLDLLLATGEQVTIALMALSLNQMGVPAHAMTGWQAGIVTDNKHSKARIQDISRAQIEQALEGGYIPVVAGFQGMSVEGEITTLGRGGSDTTAVALAAALGCHCEIYTDVDGIYTTDPRIFKSAKKHHRIAYDEMLEMASTGAGVMETRAIEMANHHKVAIYVALNDMKTPGTWIVEEDQAMEKNAVTGLSVSTNCLMTTLENVLLDYAQISSLFTQLAQRQIVVDMISQTAPVGNRVTISFTTPKEDYREVESLIKTHAIVDALAKVAMDSDVAKLSVVGIGMVSQSGVAAKLFSVLAKEQVPFYQVTTSEISISYTIPASLHQRAVFAIAKAFDL